MRAKTHYNDLEGTAAADLSNGTTGLQLFLKEENVDTERFLAIGASFYISESSLFQGSIICKDLKKSIEAKPHIVSLIIEREMEQEEFFNLFKRLEVTLTTKLEEYQNFEIEEELIIPDLSNDEEEYN